MLHCNRAVLAPEAMRNQRKDFLMAPKAKTASAEAAEGIETALKTGTEAFKTSFEKAVKGYDQLLGFGKETIEAYLKAANVAGKGAETLHKELYAYSKQSIEDTIAAAKALLASKSPQEAFELQSDFAKSAFEAYVGEVSKLNEIVVSTTKSAYEPLQGRYQAWVDTVQNFRAAA
jgi:phasin family protein